MIQRWRFRRSLRSERGAALVEFGLVLPFLMLIMCATIDFGLAMYTLNNLTAAVREGGRYAAAKEGTPTTNDQLVIDRVYSYIAFIGSSQSPTQVKSTISTSYDALSGLITVKITGYQYKPLTPLAPFFGLGVIPMNRSAIFRWERSS